VYHKNLASQGGAGTSGLSACPLGEALPTGGHQGEYHVQRTFFNTLNYSEHATERLSGINRIFTSGKYLISRLWRLSPGFQEQGEHATIAQQRRINIIPTAPEGTIRMAARHLLHYSIVSAQKSPPTRQKIERALEAAGLGAIELWETSGPDDPPGLVARFVVHAPEGVALASVEMSLQGERVVGEVNRAMFLVLARSLGAEDARILKTGQLSLEVEIIVKDASSLAYLNWAVWLIEVLLDVTQGVVIDPAAQCCRGRVEWEKCTGPFDVSRHVALHVTEWEHDTRWVHSHGMEKFAQPDLEVVEVPPSLVREAMLLVNQLAASLARGARLQPGQTLNIGPVGDAQVRPSNSPADHQEPFGRLRLTDIPTAGHPSGTHANTLLGTGAYLEGCQLAELGQLAQALDSFDRVLAADPRAEAALGAKASTLLVAQRPQEALVVAEELVRCNPTNPDGYFLAGQTLMQLGRYAKAAEAFTHAIRYNPDDAALYQGRAHCYLALNRYHEATDDQEYAARLVTHAPQSN
jgi:hypothetical protein